MTRFGAAFLYFASWSVVGLLGFWLGPEPKGRTFDEIDLELGRPTASLQKAPAT